MNTPIELPKLNLQDNLEVVNADYDFDESADQVAEDRNQIVVYPEKSQIQIDIDSEANYEEFQQRLFHLEWGNIDNLIVEEHPSRKGLPHRHITITCLQEMTEWQRLAMQAVLGYDPVRAFLNVRRHLMGVERPTRFFEDKPVIQLCRKECTLGLYTGLCERALNHEGECSPEILF